MRMGTWHRRLLLACLIAVGLSGVLWFALHDLAGLEPGEALHALLAAHGISAYAAAVAFGSVLPLHALAGCRQRRNRLSGLLTAGALAPLIGSALLLYYGGEQTQAWARLVHLTVGFAAILAVPLHIVLGRRTRCRAADITGKKRAGNPGQAHPLPDREPPGSLMSLSEPGGSRSP